MPRSATTGVYTRVVNSFSNPVFGTLIDPTDADAYFDDLDVGLNPPELDGPVRFINSLQVGTTGTAAGTVDFLNATSGSITLSPPAGALGTVTLTLPAATDTLVGKATTDVLTNKTFGGPLAITSNSALAFAVGANGVSNPVLQADASIASQAAGLKVQGGATGVGTAIVVIDSGADSPLSINAKGTGTIAIANTSTGACTIGNVTITRPAASATLTIANTKTLTASNSLTLAGTDGTTQTFQATDTIVGRATTDTLTNKTYNSSGTGNVFQIAGNTVTTVASLAALLSAPQVTVFTSGSAATYNTPSGAKYLVVEMAGGGGGGAGSGTTPGAAGAGVASSFAGGAVTLTANGGAAGTSTTATFPAGGTATGGDFNFTGGAGGAIMNAASRSGGGGGQNVLFSGGGAANLDLAAATPTAGNAAVANSGSGGGGATSATAAGPGSGGAAGGALRKLITAPNATFTYTVGGGGAGGTLGTSGAAGGNGAAGIIIITAHFQ